MDWIFPYPLTTLMGIEKQGSKGGNYVGGFLQMFDWNAKSRKKLFSSKSDVPEQSKQKKRRDGNLPSTHIPLLEVDEITAVSSVKESSDYSCSSSLVDEDFYSTRAPGVVARLMGLDSLPKSTPLFDSQSLHEDSSYYHQAKNLEYHRQDQFFTNSGSMHDLPARNDAMHTNYHRKAITRPIGKFQTEVLPPKSAKSIPTHHKLLSPIKSANFTPSQDPAQIMEAATRIMEPGRRVSSVKTKLPPVRSSSSVPLRVVDFKEKAPSARKPLEVFEGSHRKSESQSSINNNNNKGKSISLALQAKANVLKREGISVKSSRSPVSPKEQFEQNHNNNLFKSQPMAEKNTLKKNNSQNGPSVLGQNNQKQNCIVDRGKTPAKCNSKGPKSKSVGMSSKVSSKKLGPEIKDDKNKVSSSSSLERVVNRKKRSVDGNVYHGEKSQPVKNSGKTDRQISWDHQDRGKTDVISFTFTAPMTRSGPSSVGPAEEKVFSASSQSGRSGFGSDGVSSSCVGHNNMKGGDALSTLLEQKLKELAQTVEFSRQKSGLTELEEDDKDIDEMEIDNQGVLEESSMCDSSISQATKLLDCRLPSPASVLDLSPFAESCNSSDTVDSNCMGDSRQCSSVQAQELFDSLSSKTFLTIEGDIELSDSAWSNSNNFGKSKKWELEYVNEIIFNTTEPMLEDYYASGQAGGVVKSHLFDKLERQKGYLCNFGETSRIDKRIMFDCASECLDLRCKQYVSGGCKQWAKGVTVIRRKEKLAEEVYKEISGWSAIGDSMIDDLVDKDMSGQHGKWVDYDIEAFELGIQIETRILNSLIDEVVADILML